MTDITADHVEWAVVGRLQKMLEEPAHRTFNVTETYALFTATLCWVIQRIRIPENRIDNKDDRSTHALFRRLSETSIADEPWWVHVAPTARVASVESHSIRIPAPDNFATHSAARFLINLRDATAHGDARNVFPFNSESLLAGFTFSCAEFDNRKKSWEGKITRLESDMRRIGVQLAKMYCDAVRRNERHSRDGHFGRDAASIREVAA